MCSNNCMESIIESSYEILDNELFLNPMILDIGYIGIIKWIWKPN